MEKYDTFDRAIVYSFERWWGGIGDYLRFFMRALEECIEHNIKLYFLVNNTEVENLIPLIHQKMYITHKTISGNFQIINSLNEIPEIKAGVFYIITPKVFYATENELCNVIFRLQDVFYFSNQTIKNAELLTDATDYVSIHLRLGDKFLETDQNYVACPNDTRTYDESKLFKCIEEEKAPIIFFCDNLAYKLKLREMYPNIIITGAHIGHTSLSNTTERQILDAASEFYIIARSNHIFALSYSGFSLMAGHFSNVPVTKLY